jgi:hypothetical protein
MKQGQEKKQIGTCEKMPQDQTTVDFIKVKKQYPETYKLPHQVLHNLVYALVKYLYYHSYIEYFQV